VVTRSACLLAALCALLPFLCASAAWAFPSKDQNCSKCYSLTKEEALAILKAFTAKVTILSVSRSKASYLWEVSYESDGKKGLVYLDLPKKYLLFGTLFGIQNRENLTQARFSELNTVNVSRIPLGDALIVGDRKAKKKIIVFTDPDCPFCAKLHAEMKSVVAARKDIAFYVKLYPLTMHPGAYEKAKAIVCARSLDLLDDAFAKKPLPQARCATKVIDETIALAEKMGITGTPALVTQDGRVLLGFHDAQSLMTIIDKK